MLLRRCLGLALLVLAPAALVVACKPGPAKPPMVGGDAGAEAGTAKPDLAVSPPPSGLPAMAVMPPAGVAGSKKAKRKPDAALAACGAAARPQAKDPADGVKRLGEACAASKMKPLGAPFRGQQGDRDVHQENKFRAEANHCYRVYLVTEEAVKDAVIVLRDSAGDIAAESPAPAIPDDGALCFTQADEVSILVGVGSGKGAWTAQVYAD